MKFYIKLRNQSNTPILYIVTYLYTQSFSEHKPLTTACALCYGLPLLLVLPRCFPLPPTPPQRISSSFFGVFLSFIYPVDTTAAPVLLWRSLAFSMLSEPSTVLSPYLVVDTIFSCSLLELFVPSYFLLSNLKEESERAIKGSFKSYYLYFANFDSHTAISS